jgi:hypothetical protein
MLRAFFISILSLQLLHSCLAWFVLDQSSTGRIFSEKTKQPLVKTTPRRPPPSNIKILILPGFGNDASDYVLEQLAPMTTTTTTTTGSLVRSLQKRGWTDVTVLPIRRMDWLQVFWKGAFDILFWQNRASAIRPAFQWYLQLVADTIQQLLQQQQQRSTITRTTTKKNDNNTGTEESDDEDNRIILVCHSAGGWLARAALGYYGSCGKSSNDTIISDKNITSSSKTMIDLSKICGIVTLGAPHDPPPPHVMDMTRGALRDTAQRFPGAFHNEQFFYMTVIGDAVRGIPQQRKNLWEPTTVTGFAYNSYKVVCGEGETIGDGVVPIQSAHLEGAIQLNLPGIFHSINVPEQWYGSDTVIDQWHDEMMQQIGKWEKNNNNNKRPDLRKTLFGNPLENFFARNLLNDGV